MNDAHERLANEVDTRGMQFNGSGSVRQFIDFLEQIVESMEELESQLENLDELIQDEDEE